MPLKLRVNQNGRTWTQQDMVDYHHPIEAVALECYQSHKRTQCDIDPWLEINGVLCGFYKSELASLDRCYSNYRAPAPGDEYKYYHNPAYRDIYKFSGGSCLRDDETGLLKSPDVHYVRFEEKTSRRNIVGASTISVSTKAFLVQDDVMAKLFSERKRAKSILK